MNTDLWLSGCLGAAIGSLLVGTCSNPALVFGLIGAVLGMYIHLRRIWEEEHK